ncbi:GNAT family N-acetyltransferase [Paenisporosarcina indica]|uniref:GNAT family N-acetyltransferase n=1 Tax=Paenisporosarcina indica TaxID=650093 RepID=UPI00094FD411|nr:GNAT family N-acetyltransferase [Paenisporosarcina indica]
MYRKEVYVFQEGKPVKTVVRNYQKKDFQALIAIQRESFPPPFPSALWWNEEQLTNHVELYPQGALCVEINGEIVGSITGLLVDFNFNQPNHTWEEITDHGYIRNHNPKGKTLYIVDICVKPAHRKLDLGKLLMQSMYERVVHDDLVRLLGGGRMPGYHWHAKVLTLEQYVEKVVEGELRDPVISFLLRCGRTPVCLIPNYLEDEESLNYALLMEWKNPFENQ